MGASSVAAEVIALYDKLQQAADKAGAEAGELNVAEEDRAVDLMKQLQSCEINTRVLLDTQVGKRIRRLMKHSSGKIAEGASALVAQWKQAVEAENAKASPSATPKPLKLALAKQAVGLTSPKDGVALMNGRAGSDILNGGKTEPGKLNAGKTEGGKTEGGKSPGAILRELVTDEDVVSEVPATKIKTEAKQVVTITKTEVKKGSDGKAMAVKMQVQCKTEVVAGPKREKLDMSKVPKTGVEARDKMRELLFNSLSLVYNEAREHEREAVEGADLIDVVVKVEQEFHKAWGNKKEWKAQYRSLSFNIKDVTNPDFRRRILTGEVQPDQMGLMTADEMASDVRKEERWKMKNKGLSESVRSGGQSASTDQFKCGRCGQRKTTYYQLQTRSADEPMTTYVTCVHCGKRWKFC